MRFYEHGIVAEVFLTQTQILTCTFQHCGLCAKMAGDFVFLCFFVGNDFLPHIPCLSIREGGIDVLMKVYEFCLSLMPDYITKAGDINMKSLKIFIEEIAHYEEPLIG